MAQAYHDPKQLTPRPEAVEPQTESEYYAAMIRRMDFDIDVKNGVKTL